MDVPCFCLTWVEEDEEILLSVDNVLYMEQKCSQGLKASFIYLC